MDTPKLRASIELEKLIIYASMNKQDEEKALAYIDDINEYIDKYSGWNLVDANDSIKGFDYTYVTSRDGTPYISIDSVKHMLSSGISIEESKDKLSIKDLTDIKVQIINEIRERIKRDNSDCSILVSEDDVASYADIVGAIDSVFDKLKEGKEK